MVFRHYLILQVCKITDPAKSGKYDNLTTNFLLQHYDFTAESQKLAILQDLNGKMQAFRCKLLPARNKIISHSDRAAILDGRPLGGVPDNEWVQFWLNLQEFISIIYEKVFGDTMYINAVAESDSRFLLNALAERRR